MASVGVVFRGINRLFGSGTASGLTEGQLLSRFVHSRDEAAFEALVLRFGPMVLGVCRQILDDPHAADDAFQATFLVLVKKAATIREPDLLGNWLYGVALKVARKTRADRSRRQRRETGAAMACEPFGDGPSHDVLDVGPVLHEELSRLPEKYRAPVVLCDLDGRTHQEAAQALGWPVGSVKGRLSRARDILRDRLGRRGVTLSAAGVAATLGKTADASIPPLLLDRTVRAAMGFAAGGAVAAGASSVSAVALAEGVVTQMKFVKLKIVTAAVVGLGLATTGVAMARFGSGGQDPEPSRVAEKVGETSKQEEVKTETSVAQSPENQADLTDSIKRLLATELNPEANASPVKLAANRVEAAEKHLAMVLLYYERGTVTIDRVLLAAREYTEARSDAARDDQAARYKAIEEYARMLEGITERERARQKVGTGSLPNITEAESALAEALVVLAQTHRPDATEPTVSTRPASVTDPAERNVNPGLVSDDPEKDAKIWEALDRSANMNILPEMSLADMIKYIKTITDSPEMPKGLPIYLDRKVLEDVGKTENDMVSINAEGIKLKTSLRLLLKQHDLGFYVKHGLVIITALDSEDYRDETHPGWREEEASREKAERKGKGAGGFGND